MSLEPTTLDSRIICVDFDGTCVTHEYPAVGTEIVGAVATLRALVAQGHKIVLWTMRHGESLQAAEAWFAEREIPLYGVNCNPSQKAWTESPKAYGHVYIDDAALGCPLAFEGSDERRPEVDWLGVGRLLMARGFIPRRAKTYER